jgi:DNA-binding transcriptional LysR family regulator
MLNEIDLSRTDLNLLVLFEVVMAERHVGRSAQRLNLSPSAVSHGLGRLRTVFADPLFLKTPKGVVPTARAAELAAPVADVLARVRGVIAGRTPFDPARSSRRFTIGAPDGLSAVFLLPLLGLLRQAAPGVKIAIRQLPPVAMLDAGSAWLVGLLERTGEATPEVERSHPLPPRRRSAAARQAAGLASRA